ncbi:MAG: outer membrane protein transport protein [Spirochaetes bacterium]|jgi:long-chain fatty acid transport protein|nr:outer membrane protein transport protein [Spirochaetota bacterium]MBP8988222.1 outer membrane protein transport protein [Spirochaetota bacterium]
MKTSFKVLSIAAMVLFVAANAFATNGMRMIGFGPVQRSMGGIGVATTLDAASIITNPAGIADLKGRIDFGASYFSPTVKHKGQGAFSSTDTIESDAGASPVPAFGLVIPLTEKLHFGIGAYGVSGMGVDYEQNVYMSILKTMYSQMRFAPGLSYKINDMISVGAVANIMYATMEFSAATAMGQEAHMNSAAFGYGATIAVNIKPVDMLTIAVAYETKSNFKDFEFNTNLGKDKLEFDQPQSVTAGFSVTPLKDLTVAFEVQWIEWSETNGKNKPEFSKNSSGATAWNMNWDNQMVYKIGAQYVINPMFTVRAGFNYGKMPLDEDRAFENVAFPAIAEYHYTAGIGISFDNNLTLNIGGMYSPEAKIDGANALQGIADYETKMSQYSLDMGIAYVF